MSLLTKRKLLMIIWCIIMICIPSSHCKASDMNEVPVQTVEPNEVITQTIEPIPIANPTFTPMPTPKQTSKPKATPVVMIPKIKYRYANAYVKVRKKASKKSAQKFLLKPGQKVQVIKKSKNWTKVKYNKKTGYVQNKTLSAQKIRAIMIANKKVKKYALTGYCPCYTCSEGFGRKTRSGRRAKANHTIAADLSVLPLYTDVYIEGMGVYTVEDRGGGVKGRHIDVYCNKHYQCSDIKSSAKVFIVE